MKNVILLVTAFVALIIGIALLGTVATEGLSKTELTTISSETNVFVPINNTDINTTYAVTLTQAPTGWKASDTDCEIANFGLSNGTDSGTVTTDYVLTAAAGTYTMKDTVFTETMIGANETTVGYDYCADDYLTEGWQRTVLNLVSGFFAIALLMISLGIFYAILKNEGLLNI